MMPKPLDLAVIKKAQVAIDGPAGVGKTTTARTLAKQLGLLYVDTGAMYRALAVWARTQGVSVDDAAGSAVLAKKARIRFETPPGGSPRVLIEDSDLTRAIRSPDASEGASRISVHPAVRKELVRQQRVLARRRGVVMEGRDIGTVVLPDAGAKVFLTASAEERARRRHRELEKQKQPTSLEQVLLDILERDARDLGREISPLLPAPDAVVLDCTAFDPTTQISVVRRVVETLLMNPEIHD